MRIIAICITAAALAALHPARADAQSAYAVQFGQKVAEKIVTSLLGAAAGKAFKALFGSEQNQVTIEQIEHAINTAFEHATVGDIVAARKGLTNKVDDYNPDRSVDRKLDAVANILDRTGDLQGAIDAHISKNTSMPLISAFIMATNTRIAFAAERYALDKVESDRDYIADYVADGLEALNKYMREDFSDTGRHGSPCIAKAPDVHLRLNGSEGSNWSEKAVDVSTWYCYGNGRVLKTEFGKSKKMAEALRYTGISDGMVVNLGGAYYMRSTDLGKARNTELWLFAAKPGPQNNRYRLYQTGSEEHAHLIRNSLNSRHYPHSLGDLHALAASWLDVAKAAKSPVHFEAALKAAFALGVSPNKLRSYGHGSFNGWMNSKIASLGHPWPSPQLNEH